MSWPPFFWTPWSSHGATTGGRGILNWCLVPFSWLYCLFFFIKFYSSLLTKKKVSVPVICIGNVVAGGTGKTPMALAIAKLLEDAGKKIAFLSRGYGGNLSTYDHIIKVDNEKHHASQVGDEPLLLSAKAATYICIDRYKSALKAIEDGSTLLIMDDGMQNNTLHKDCNILVIDSNYFIGNGFLLPAGPMREPLWHILSRTDMVILIGGKKVFRKHPFKGFKGKVFYAESKIAVPAHIKKAKKCVLLTAIARPYRVVDSLKESNIEVFHHFSYPDHYCFSIKDIEGAIKYAKNAKLPLVTTLKDIVKIPQQYKKNFVVLKHNIELDEEGILHYIFTSILMR